MRIPKLSLLLIFLLQALVLLSQDVTGKWSGIMTVELWWEGITGPSHKRFDMTIQDNVVTGTMTGTGKLIIGGKELGHDDCSGTGTGELWRLAFNADGTYDLEVISHPFTCNTVSALDNNGQPTITTDNHEDLMAHDQPIPRNRNVLTGTIDTSGESAGLGKFHRYISWTLTNGPLDAFLIVDPLKYNTWMPKPGMDELMKGEAMAVNLKVQSRNGGPPMIEAEKFEIRLIGTSSEPGTTINYPLNSTYNLPDLRLLPDANMESPDPGQYMELQCSNGSTGFFFIGSYDGGGWTDLKVVAILKGGIRIEGHLINPNGITTIPIPKRKAGSHIADAWLQAHGNPGESDDKEHVNGNPHDGDGLTAYEEYRGVWSLAQHVRLFPDKKELGIQSKRNIWPFFDGGAGLFKSASGIEVIKFIEDEIDTDRRLNKNNRTSHDYDQYVLKIDTGQTTKSAAGENRPISLDHMLPKESEEVVINISYMNDFYPRQTAAAVADHVTMPYTLNELITSTIAHEIAHGVNVNHHGDDPSNGGRSELWEGAGDNHVFDRNGREIPLSQWPLDQSLQKHYYKMEGKIGAPSPGSAESGDMTCFMCYTSYYNWSFVLGANGSLNYYKVPLLATGKILCGNKNATSINLKPYFFGMAARGNCLEQLQLR